MIMDRATLGVFGGMVWQVIPELRPAVKEMICDRLQTAIDIDEEPDIELGDFVTFVIGPQILTPMEEDREDPVLVVRLAELVRRAVAYDGPGRERFHDLVDLFFLENLDFEAAQTKLRAVAPDIGPLITNFQLSRK
nr:hypothetical protein [Micromonospora sp. DSM 115978]